jgi:hypothetical protein
LKNCADAGAATPTNSATATANTISGPVSVNTRKKDFLFGMRFGRNGRSDKAIIAESGRTRAVFEPHMRTVYKRRRA